MTQSERQENSRLACKGAFPFLFVIFSIFAVNFAAAQELNAPSPTEEQREGFSAGYEKAKLLSSNGDRDAAIAQYTALLAEYPDNSDLLLGRGLEYSWQGNWQKAESDLSVALSRSPEYTDLWLALGNVYSWSDQSEKAIHAYTQVIKLESSDPSAYLSRAKEYKKVGEFEAARQDLLLAQSVGAESAQIDELLRALEISSIPAGELLSPKGYLWSINLSTSYGHFTPEKDKWQDKELSLRHYFDWGSIALEGLEVERFRYKDRAIAIDGYSNLWDRAYANIRFQYTNESTLFPDNSWRIEIFQGVLTGWEISGSYDHLNFGASPVKIYSLGAGKYVSNYYFRIRHVIVPNNDGKSTSEKALIRYYFSGDADNYYEINASIGRTDNQLIIDRGQDNRYSVGAALAYYPASNFGCKIGFTYASESNNFIERDISASLSYRW